MVVVYEEHELFQEIEAKEVECILSIFCVFVFNE
jgi:hypothetical protein